MATVYKSRIDWWIPAVVVFTAVVAIAVAVIGEDFFIVGVLVGILLCILEIAMFLSVKYQICDGKLGIRNLFYKWEWFPIDKISEVKKTCGILSAPALSTKRVSIRFSDRSVLRSSIPLEISPKDRDGFVAKLVEISPGIILKK